MPRARKHLVCLSDTPFYHVYSRCVRRAFLCGVDRHTGRSYEHRRAWIEDRVRVLASLFSIDLCAYAIMSNHYHLVVKLNPTEPDAWSDDEVLQRWTSLFRGPLLVQRYRAGVSLSPAQLDTVRESAAVYRARLGSLSWFMKCLNEPIARQANAEDHCTGHFWEARFHSQALRSEKALLAAMAYVDLNPVRAQLAETPEASEYTSIRARILGDYRRRTQQGAAVRMLERDELFHFELPIRPLLGFRGGLESDSEAYAETADTLPIRAEDYLQLVDATGRLVAAGKNGRIDPALSPILDRIGLSSKEWAQASTAFRHHYRNGDLRLRNTA
jgi:REP element-mobilizing transposase RayT